MEVVGAGGSGAGYSEGIVGRVFFERAIEAVSEVERRRRRWRAS